jgi:glycyl-tRNA synthetase
LTFTDRLGSMADRAGRIGSLALSLASSLGLSSSVLSRAASLVKFDLGSQLVTEMTSLAGVMARDYALHAGEPRAVAQAVYEAELPRNTGDDLPASVPGALLSLADRLDLVAGLAATVGLPTGSSDPFAVRRAVLGLLAVHRAHPALAGLSLADALREAASRQPVPVSGDVLAACGEFLAKRLEQTLVEEGFAVDRVRAVLPHAARPSVAANLLTQLASVLDNPDFSAVAEAIQRARRIVPPSTPASFDAGVLKEPAEVALVAAVAAARSALGSSPSPSPDLFQFTSVVSRLVEPLATFFDEIFVMDEDLDVRAARLGLLATVRDLGDGVLDWAAL